MNRLFIELYLDEDVSVIVGDILRARGFVAITTQEAGRLASSDQEQRLLPILNSMTADEIENQLTYI